ncbi:hypothetical protein EDEG_03236 [Edhazardia aedis USNM 41457]|uniref:Uncharacterized protein n=1 Tax=Edhazardia aedis (strain USNM 41457) TaxID=1003232 RepID=J9D454_EDHAE|nr:hypothetical protein EDEG_03236 [Edhazardia aedis USNM 41457]|eukprot:EJW02334.1 hypothetical protein EDEG_03236 [Edhazardia aedis USNM 41457]
MIPEHPSDNGLVGEVSRITSEIQNNLEELCAETTNKISKLKTKTLTKIREITTEIDCLKKEHAEKKQKNIEMLKERSSAMNIAEIEDEELAKFQAENQALNQQINKLKVEIDCVIKETRQLEGESIAVERKMRILESSRQQKESVYAKKANYLRKALGLDILPVKDNVIKIEFKKKTDDEVPAFIVLDFELDNLVIDCSAEWVELETLNNCYKKNRDFYTFVKIVRKIVLGDKK